MFKSLPFFSSAPSYKFLLFAMMLFFLFVADAIMSYFAPVIIEQVTGSSIKMGIILASSSIVGMITDFSFAQLFHHKRAFFFERLLFLLVFLLPLSFFLSHSVTSFVMAMAWWGVSYEAMTFVTYHAIHEAVGRVHHAWAWGLVSILKNIALSIGPIIASMSFAQSPNLPVYYAIILNAVAVFLFILYQIVEKKTKGSLEDQLFTHPTIPHRTLKETIQIWKTLDRVLWPLFLFIMLFFFFDSAVFSIGPLFSEHLSKQHEWGSLFVSLYGIPGIFVGFFIHKLSKPFGKKKLSFITGILGGLSAICMSISSSVFIILGSMFLTSFWLSIMYPAMTAVFEDFVSRGEKVANDLISMTAITGSFSYVVGPIVNGFLNDRFGELMVFEIWGGAILFASIWLILTFPRKVRLPQKQLDEVIVKAV